MSRLKEIHNYLLKNGITKKQLMKMDESTVSLSLEIMEYAHRNQRRENSEKYMNHPFRCLQNYRNLFGIVPDDPLSINKELMDKYKIPYEGVQEVCLLHDVIEDTDFTIEEIEEIFDECHFNNYFSLFIKEALTLITHKKDVDYEVYIKMCMENPISSIVKMMDLQDNLNVLSLNHFDEKRLQRAGRYLLYLYLLNGSYQFIESASKIRMIKNIK